MRRGATVVVAGLVLLAGCGAVGPEPVGTPSARPRLPPASSATRDQAFATDTLQDWVTYGDRVVTVRMVREGRQAPSEEEAAQGRRSPYREVTWHPVSVLWANPARPREDPPATGTSSGGTYTSDTAEARAETYGGDPLLVVGHTYLAVLTHTAIGGPREWIPMAMLPCDDDLIGDGEQFRGWEGQEETLDAVWGTTGAQVAELLGRTPPDPDARAFASEDAAEKYQHTARVRNARDPYTPGPGPGEHS